MSNILIAYYSRKGENYWNGGVKILEKGNTEMVAEMIADTVDGVLFEIDTVNAYPESYSACTKVAVQELQTNTRPNLTHTIANMERYSTIFLGYPNWCGTMPMPVFTFLESYSFDKKTIIPFCTNEGSGMGHSESDLKKACPMAIITKGLAIRGTQVSSSQSIIAEWAKECL